MDCLDVKIHLQPIINRPDEEIRSSEDRTALARPRSSSSPTQGASRDDNFMFSFTKVVEIQYDICVEIHHGSLPPFPCMLSHHSLVATSI